jgi:site-specific DNA-methyltransferase (adenine-specific)
MQHFNILKEYENIKLYHGDCMDLMRETPDKYYDIAIVDPPYGLERFKKGGSHVNKYGSENGQWNNEKPTKEYFDELFRVSKNQIIWGANNFELPTSEYFIIWQKSSAEDFSFAMCEMAWTNCKVPAKIYRKLHVSVEDKRKIHPTQKPIELYKWLLHNYTSEGDLILDTHLGSGSIAIAIDKANKINNMNLRFTGIELDVDYYNSMIKRFEAYISQLTLNLI